ncbi:MAG: AlwI family type II restriction endonuclease [Chloroflexi bacterium]|nr:AlwI family type II restriction endonuclease [Chloroflexota bacterium]
MSRYISLNSHTQLEQTITGDLKSVLEKCGFSVIHNGAWDSHAPGGKPDIIVFDQNYVLIFEVTKSKSAAQDREIQPIRSHLKDIKAKNPEKECFCVFVSPKTSERTFDSIHDHNYQRASEGKFDMKILPLAFDTFELWVTRLMETPWHKYPIMDFINLFGQYNKFTDDSQIFNLLVERVFPNDGIIHELIMRQDHKSKAAHLSDLVTRIDQVNTYENDLSEFDIKLRSFFDLFADRFRRTWDGFTKSEGLTMAQVYVLQELYYQGPCNMSSISGLLKITSSATSQLTEKLVQSRLVERTENPENRRMKQLALSPGGMAFVEEGIRRQRSWMDEIEQSLSKEEFEQVSGMFEILTQAAQSLEEKK